MMLCTKQVFSANSEIARWTSGVFKSMHQKVRNLRYDAKSQAAHKSQAQENEESYMLLLNCLAASRISVLHDVTCRKNEGRRHR
mmetsp:Transcript_18268/g.32094  ORF Transcript_18268/g.32094 Transcript_18268/m.32094 type:complete len:84 (+) Transcript_18268:1528-1779(+)